MCVNRLSPKAHLSIINAGKMSYELEEYEQAELFFRSALDLMKPPTSGKQRTLNERLELQFSFYQQLIAFDRILKFEIELSDLSQHFHLLLHTFVIHLY